MDPVAKKVLEVFDAQGSMLVQTIGPAIDVETYKKVAAWREQTRALIQKVAGAAPAAAK